MAIFGTAHGWGGEGGAKTPASLYKICHTSYKDEPWHSHTLPKEDPKNT